MRRARWIMAFALSLLMLSTSSLQAQPPAPNPPGFPEFVKLLDDAYTARNLKAYGDLFREDVKVYVDGTLVATDREGLLARIQSEFDQQLRVQTTAWAQGGGQILVLEAVIGCLPDHIDPKVAYHPCPEARAVRYDIEGGWQTKVWKIKSVTILRADEAHFFHVGSN